MNTFGKNFRITTFGESHGPALGVVIDGVPPNLAITTSEIQKELDRRKPGQSKYTTSRKESDEVEILSGVFNGKTTGMPIALLIRNHDHKSTDYDKLKDMFRPGHADFTYLEKYGLRDYRGGGRASGRETAARVAAGAIAKKLLVHCHVQVVAYTLAVAGIYAKKIDLAEIEKNPLRTPDKAKVKAMCLAIEQAQSAGDSVGGIIEAKVIGCPPGIGEPVFNKLDAMLAQAVMSIGAVKGVEIGAGFAVAGMRGSECNDEFFVKNKQVRTKTNNAGGILGGISTGEEIVLRAAVKPTPSIMKTQKTVDKSLRSRNIEVAGRHDPCICPRIVPVVEAMVAITIIDYLGL